MPTPPSRATSIPSKVAVLRVKNSPAAARAHSRMFTGLKVVTSSSEIVTLSRFEARLAKAWILSAASRRNGHTFPPTCGR